MKEGIALRAIAFAVGAAALLAGALMLAPPFVLCAFGLILLVAATQ